MDGKLVKYSSTDYRCDGGTQEVNSAHRWLCAFKQLALRLRQIRVFLRVSCDDEGRGNLTEVSVALLPRKASKLNV